MSKIRAVLWLVIWTAAAPPALAQAGDSGKKSAAPAGAEPLPPGARLRLGSGGLTAGEPAGGGALSPDGRILAVAGRDAVTLFDRKTGKPLARVADNGMQPGLAKELAFSRDGKVLAVGGFQSIEIADVPGGQVLHRLEVPEPKSARVQGISFSADGKTIAAGTSRPGVNRKAKAFVWAVTDGKLVATIEVLQNVNCFVALAPDGKRLATWGRHAARMIGEDQTAGQIVQLWDLTTGKERCRFKADRADTQIGAVTFSPDSKTFAVATGLSTFHLVDADSGQERRRFAGRRSRATLLEYSPDGALLVAGGTNGTIQGWHVESGQRLALPRGPKVRALSFAFPAAGQVLVLGIAGQNVVWWDAISGQGAATAPGHHSPVVALAFESGGKTLTSVGADGEALFWDAGTGRLLRTITLIDDDAARMIGGANRVRLPGLVLSPDARFVASAGMVARRIVQMWDLGTGQVACDFEASNGLTNLGLAFAHDGRRVAAIGTSTRTIDLWATDSGQEIRKLTLKAPQDVMGSQPPLLALSSDGKQVAVASVDATGDEPAAQLALLDTVTGKQLYEVKPAIGDLEQFATRAGTSARMAFAPDDRLLALPGPNQMTLVLHADTGNEWRHLGDSGAADMTALAFAPDGRTLAIARGGARFTGPQEPVAPAASVLEVWELASGSRRLTYKGPAGSVNALAYAPDGLTLAAGGDDGAVMIWDVGIVPAGGSRPLTSKELAAAWNALAGPDAAAAFGAQRQMIGTPAETVAFLKEHLTPARPPAVNEKQLQQWVYELDSENFATRDTAYRTLDRLGTFAEPVLRKARLGNPALEMRRRIDDLLAKLERGVLSPEVLQGLRAVEVLDRIGTPEARTLIADLVKGAATAPLTQDARRVLQRTK